MPDAPTHYARYAAALNTVDALAEKYADTEKALAPVTSLHFSDEALVISPWLFCRPVTALLSWADALPGRTAVAARSLGETGTELVATSKLAGLAVTLSVITYHRDIEPGPVNLAALRALAAGEGAPDLSADLDIETIVAPNVPMPPLDIARTDEEVTAT